MFEMNIKKMQNEANYKQSKGEKQSKTKLQTTTHKTKSKEIKAKKQTNTK